MIELVVQFFFTNLFRLNKNFSENQNSDWKVETKHDKYW